VGASRDLLLLLISYRGLVTSNHLATNQGGRGTQALVPPEVTEAPLTSQSA